MNWLYKFLSDDINDRSGVYTDIDGQEYWGKQASGILLIKIIKNKPYFFITQRSEHVMDPHLWSVPGGASRDYELLESAIRETTEEIGGFPENYRVLDKQEWQAPGGNFKYTTFVILCLDEWNSNQFNWEVSDVGWFDVEEIMSLNLHPAFREVLSRIIPKLSTYFN